MTLRAIGYVSAIDPSNRYTLSLPDQKLQIEEYCRKHNIHLKQISEGTDADPSHRESIITTLDALSSGDILVVYSVYALSYRVGDFGVIYGILHERKNTLHCIFEDIKTVNSQAFFSLSMMTVMYHLQKSLLSNNGASNCSFDVSSYDFKCKGVMYNGKICNKKGIYRKDGKCYCGSHIRT